MEKKIKKTQTKTKSKNPKTNNLMGEMMTLLTLAGILPVELRFRTISGNSGILHSSPNNYLSALLQLLQRSPTLN